jgi:hypothetical protein
VTAGDLVRIAIGVGLFGIVIAMLVADVRELLGRNRR